MRTLKMESRLKTVSQSKSKLNNLNPVEICTIEPKIRFPPIAVDYGVKKCHTLENEVE